MKEINVGLIVGDGIGTDVVPAAVKIIDAALKKTGEASIIWKELLVGEIADKQGKERLSDEVITQIKELKTVLKGPLTTPIGKGFRSLNVALRQKLDLYACIRPVKYFEGVPSPMKNPDLDIVLFRENTEDVYAGIEWDVNHSKEIIDFVNSKGFNIRKNSGIGIKPISEFGSKRLVKAAFEYAKKNGRKKVTLVHKGNIMKYTEGAFKDWGYEVAKDYPEIEVTDIIADAMFQQLLLRPAEYDVIATTNLNGDYLSDAAAAQTGGLGIAPGANINYSTGIAVFEATHGTAPKYTGLNKVNPGSVILSGVMMLEYLGLEKTGKLITDALIKTIGQKKVTYDLARQLEGAVELKTSEFAEAIIGNF